MRSDMAKMICECLRVGDKTKYRAHRRKTKHIGEDGENLPRRESMRKWATSSPYGGKEFGEHLAPLHRYLEKQVNRPWDNVFSEICEHIKMDSTVQRHIREHVDMYVEQNAQIIDGKVYSRYYWGGRPSQIREGDLYVCPKSGLLKKATKKVGYPRRSRRKPQVKNYIEIDEFHQIHAIDGIWYEITLAKVEDIELQPGRMSYDCLNGYYGSLKDAYGRTGVYGKSKRQLGKKDLKAWGLENAQAA